MNSFMSLNSYESSQEKKNTYKAANKDLWSMVRAPNSRCSLTHGDVLDARVLRDCEA